MNKAVLHQLFISLLAFCMLLASSAHAASYLLVPAQSFYRDSGSPVTQTLSFTALDTVSSYTINLYNGGLEDYEVTGELVSSSTIALNGNVTFSPNEFNQNTVSLSKTINVNTSNQLEITLNGKPGGVIAIDIVGEDNVPPQIEATVTPVANVSGWHKSQVVVSYECDDGESGIAICPAAQTINVEGATQIISATAVDVAGNQTTATVTLNIDQTPPDVTSAANPVANVNNWNNTAVTVTYSCQDSLSGVASCSQPVTVSAEGASQTFTGQGTDIADNNASTTHTLNIDLTPPLISTTLSLAPNISGWHKNDVTVTFQCDDALSGYASCPPAITLITEGANQTIEGSVTDNADNTSNTSVILNLDKTSPVVTSSADPLPNVNGWNKSAVSINFDCQDPVSGVANCALPVTVSTEGANQTVTGQGSDIADNTVSTTHSLNIDLTPPLISTILSAAPNASGWHNSDVTTTFVCDDLLSGVVDCSPPYVLIIEAANQIVSGAVSDNADNTASASVSLNLDKTAPIVTSVATPLPNTAGWNKTSVTVNFDCQDPLSGTTDCSLPVTLDVEGANQSVPGLGTDNADNTSNITHTLNIDLTPPVISTVLDVQPNVAGWHNRDLIVSFVCNDTLSGYLNCPLSLPVAVEGSNQIINGTVIDVADNTASTSIALNVDKTLPVVTATIVPLPNANGWHKSSATVNFDCQDTLSGVAACDAPVVVATEGASQSITGQGTDVAGNTADVIELLNIDLTLPVINATLSAPANVAGWHNSDLTVTYTCEDTLSGFVNCPVANSLVTEGSNQTISASVTDNADNTGSTSFTLNLDKTAPVVTTTTVPLPNANGWHKSSATVNFDCQDTLSGVAVCDAPVVVATEGASQSITGQGIDVAGNTAEVIELLNIDLTLPVINATLSAPANVAGWHNSDLTVTYTCEDTLSGFVNCPVANSLVTEGSNQTISASVTDNADNTGSTSFTLNLDKTAPVVTATTDPLPNANGWHKSSATVNFDCQDPLSGVAACDTPIVVSAEGAAQNITGAGSDIAENITQITQILNIDLTPPTIATQFSAVANSAGWFNTPVILSFTCDDLLSGMQTCPGAITISNDVQGQVVTVTAGDKADNTVSQEHVVNLDATAPQILFTAPLSGVELATLQPVIELTLSDNMMVDDSSLVLTVNGSAFPGSCSITAGSAVCTPDSNFPRGPIHIQASITDIAGNTTSATHDFRIQEDRDNDGVPDVDDVFPDDPAEWADLDGDGVGDNSDPDIDGDGISNDYETQVGTNPTDPASVPPDLDGDGTPDSIDDDVDGDGVPNALDVFPNDSTESADLDGDGIGDSSDTDRDGDGFTNDEEIQGGSNPDDANDVPGANLRISFAGTNPFTTEAQFVDLTGAVYGDTIDRVYLTNDQFAGTTFAGTVTNNIWTARIALKLGANSISAHVEGNAGELADSVTNVQRTEPALVVELVFDTPANNSLVDTPNIVVTGRVVSEAAVELPQVSVNNIVAQVVQGASPTQFNFNAAVTLHEGSNTIIASTVVAGQALQQTLTLNYQADTAQVLPPAVAITSPQPGTTLTTDSFVLSVLVQSDAGILSITINGQPETLSASNQVEKTLSFAGQSQLDVTIVVTDNLNQVSTLNASYTFDDAAPVIQVDILEAYPAENTVTENPYKLTGTVTDVTLLQLTLNDQLLTLEPTAIENTYRFNTSLAVPVGTVNSIILQATDAAGNETTSEYLLTATSDIQIEWLAPGNNSEILLEGTGQTLDVSARLSDVTGIGGVQVEIVDQAITPVILSLDTDIVSGQITLPESEGEYTLRLSVLDTNSAVLTSSNRNIQLKLAQILPLSVVKLTPEDEAIDAEPNDFVAVFFNKPVDLNLLSIELNETVHGFSYVDVDPSGLDGIHAQGYVLQEVNRDYEVVPGLYSLLPNNTTAVFYPQRDMAYAADMYITVRYDGEEMARRHFKVRPRPTFIEGIVVDNLTQAVAGVEVYIPELNRTAITNKDGAYAFGYGDSAQQTLPGGNYHLTVNAGLKDRRFGSYDGFINIQSGTQNQISNISLPVLNKSVAFSYLNSGITNVINGGELNLDASNASFVFDNGRNEGAVHMQFLTFSSIKQPAFKTEYTPIWAYGFQPVGVKVQGDLQLDFALPKYQGSYDYAPQEGELVVLLGTNEENTHLIPVGVGEAVAGHRIKSVGGTHLNKLDYIAYARVTFEQWADLNAYKNGELDIQNLTLRLQIYVYVPPANEAEAIERANAILGQ